MASRRQLLRRQRRWAQRAGLAVDAAGYLPTVSENLRAPLSASALADFNARGAAEFHDGERHVARMRAVHSSTALGVNLFDHWNTADPAPLAAVLGLPAPVVRLVFEPHLPTAAGGSPANPDLDIELGSGELVAVECKFSEWLVPSRKRRDVFDGRYFPAGPGVWLEAGLPACQALADDLQSGREYFRYLEADQLLKHSLGLQAARQSRWALIYLYFEWPGPIGLAHQAELQRFAERVKGEAGFSSTTLQAVSAGLCESAAPVEAGYLDYLQLRYMAHA
ncbi:MAG: hypothetical protein E4H19_07785 [Chromatiales bacterium]|jgi:hypothetical protein|nr:MAG: hypothetical protein E4H19_07785 [Chromatiales bacterium]